VHVIVVGGSGWGRDWIVDTVATAGWSVRTAESTVDACLAAAELAAVLVLVDVSAFPLGTVAADRFHRAGARVVGLSMRRCEGELEAALASGVDAFIQCPVGDHELVARLRAVARRPVVRRDPAAARLTVGALVLERDPLAVLIDGTEVPAPVRELVVLERLAQSAPSVVHRDDLVRALRNAAPDAPSLELVVRRLRERLEAVEGWRRIEAVRGVGLRLLVGDRRPAFTGATAAGNEGFDPSREPAGL
jgi:DNA-binding response OmpR family regulator